jgi:hypothetical protein
MFKKIFHKLLNWLKKGWNEPDTSEMNSTVRYNKTEELMKEIINKKKKT